MAAPANPGDITPRQVANKSDKRALHDALRMTLDVQSAAIRRNTQTFNRNRYTAIAGIADYDAMKDRARQTKENAIANLPALLQQLEASVRANGGHFFLAKTLRAQEWPAPTNLTQIMNLRVELNGVTIDLATLDYRGDSFIDELRQLKLDLIEELYRHYSQADAYLLFD